MMNIHQKSKEYNRNCDIKNLSPTAETLKALAKSFYISGDRGTAEILIGLAKSTKKNNDKNDISNK